MSNTDKLSIYQEVHTRLVYMDIALELATRIVSATTRTFDNVAVSILEACNTALGSATYRVIVFLDENKRYDYSFPNGLSDKDDPNYQIPIYECLFDDGNLGNEEFSNVMSALSGCGYVRLSRHSISSTDIDITTPKSGKKTKNGINYLIVPIAQKSVLNHIGFIEISSPHEIKGSADIEFIKIVGVILLGALKRVEAELLVENERETLSNALRLTTDLLEESARIRSKIE